MRLMTINEAAWILDCAPQQLRRGIQAGRYAYVQVGPRKLVDVDELAAIIEAERAAIGIREAAALTGLSEATVRRWAKDGRLPCVRTGKVYTFVPAELLAALEGMKQRD